VQSSLAVQRVLKALAKGEQVHGILRRVLEHVAGQRSHRPVRALVLLVQADAEEALEEGGEPERLDSEELGGDTGVEDVRDAPAVVLMQEPQVVVGVMEDHLDVARFEERAESRVRLDLQRVDDGVAALGRELEEVDAVDVPVEARTLGVEREGTRPGDRGQESVRGLGGFDVLRSVGPRGSGHGAVSSGRVKIGGQAPQSSRLTRRWSMFATNKRVEVECRQLGLLGGGLPGGLRSRQITSCSAASVR
jgi:hypothetical protein